MMRESVFGTKIVGTLDTDLPADKLLEKAISRKEYLLCAAERIGGPFSTDQILSEIRKILIDEALENMIRAGLVEYNEETKILKKL